VQMSRLSPSLFQTTVSVSCPRSRNTADEDIGTVPMRLIRHFRFPYCVSYRIRSIQKIICLRCGRLRAYAVGDEIAVWNKLEVELWLVLVCERQGSHVKNVIFLSEVSCPKSSNPIVGMDYANKVATYVLSA
jgi:hypothetical protein